ncbi:myelin protein zero-like protein 2 isoform X2 [Scyliorhinus torazame]|uniref:myelin protein zero-like protein 2 isoform X2 n=1 Tax=Scyliorhinus torazame TaxID=75743 RepID=UPI003B596A82
MWPQTAACLLLVTLTGISDVAAVTIYTGGNVEARNGTEQRFKCTFKSTSPISRRTTVAWQFRPLETGNEESVFYYHEEPFPASKGRFKGRVGWSGDIWRQDASITITELQFTDNGTFVCTVKNPPDVDGASGEIKLSVVHKVTYSEMLILGIVIGGATALVVLIVVIVVIVQLLRKRRIHEDEEEHDMETEYETRNGTELEKLNSEAVNLTEAAESAGVS